MLHFAVVYKCIIVIFELKVTKLLCYLWLTPNLYSIEIWLRVLFLQFCNSEEEGEVTREEIGARKAVEAGHVFTNALTVTQEDKLHKLVTHGCTLVIRNKIFFKLINLILLNVN